MGTELINMILAIIGLSSVTELIALLGIVAVILLIRR